MAFFFFKFCLFFFVLHFCSVICTEFEVGGDEGWVIPPSKGVEFFNQWAYKIRFKINDTLHFTYKKDSVMAVTKAEYEKCRSRHPIYFSNNGNSLFTFDRSGLFCFISGVSRHCERGVKMIIKVLELETTPPPPPPPENQTHKKEVQITYYFANRIFLIWSRFTWTLCSKISHVITEWSLSSFSSFCSDVTNSKPYNLINLVNIRTMLANKNINSSDLARVR